MIPNQAGSLNELQEHPLIVKEAGVERIVEVQEIKLKCIKKLKKEA